MHASGIGSAPIVQAGVFSVQHHSYLGIDMITKALAPRFFLLPDICKPVTKITADMMYQRYQQYHQVNDLINWRKP